MSFGSAQWSDRVRATHTSLAQCDIYTRKTMGNLDIIALTLPPLAKPTSLRGRSRKGMPSHVPAPYFLHTMTDKYVIYVNG
jgi:hypothetical protein